jgi:zinc transport system ATP-binding protein
MSGADLVPTDTTTRAACVVTIRGGAVQLGGRPVLRGIDLDVRAGEVLAVLGANGSGKSTLVRTMLGLVPTVRGDVELFGVRLAEFQDWRRVGFVPQRAGAASGVPATVREVVASGRLSRRRPFWPMRAADRAAVDAAIHAVGLDARSGDGVATLSGGQQQRVLIARALAGEPHLLVLDEPTAGVDVASQQSFADAVRGLVSRGTTVVLVAHELGPMAGLVDRAVVMREGRVAYDGAPIAAFTDVDHPWAHGHHHPDLELSASDVSHAPGVAAPFDTTSEEKPQ